MRLRRKIFIMQTDTYAAFSVSLRNSMNNKTGGGNKDTYRVQLGYNVMKGDENFVSL
jgi:hypothetical protein